MDWPAECDDEYAELMEDYPQLLPAIERACRFEDGLAALEERLKRLEEGGA